MALPFISNFGDENHEEGETGLTVDGFDLGSGLDGVGELWMYQNADRTGSADQLTVGTWRNEQLTGVEIPASPNNATGTVYAFVKRFGDNAWSLAYTFTLTAAGGGSGYIGEGGRGLSLGLSLSV